MDLRDYIRVLRLRWRLITACALVALSAAATVSLLTKPVYQCDAKLFVRAADASGSVSNAYTGSLFTQQRVKSYKEFVTSPIITQRVADKLRDSTLTAGLISSKLSADANLDTVNLNIHGRDGDPARSCRITQAAAEVFRDYVGSLEAANSSDSPVKLEIVVPAGHGNQVLPRTKLNLALGLLVGLAIGVGLAVLKEVLDTRVKSPAELEERFKLATLTVIGFDPGAQEHPLIVREDPRSARSEAFRRLRTNLQFVDVDRRPRSIVITSSVEGEGKTTTSCNVAIALADAGIPVILIDGDLRRPSVAKYLGVEQSIGLTNVLIGHVDLDDALQPWGPTGKMKVLPAGILPPNPSELLGSQHMHDLITTLEERALVIIDAPPLLPVTDGAILAAEASGALLVVRMNKTRREQVHSAVESVRSLGAHVFGTVLNMAPTKGPDAYNYGYGYYGSYVANNPPIPAVPPPVRQPKPEQPSPPSSAEGPADPAAEPGERTRTILPGASS